MTVPLKNVPKKKYESFEDAWNVEGSHGPAPVTELALTALQPFPDHRFELYQGQRKAQMLASVQEFGVLMPLIVWKQENGQHIILSGHNRFQAALESGLTKVPVVVKENLTMEEATLVVTETNLRQRSFSDLSHSQRAFCLAQHYEASKCQGKRSDLMEEISLLLGQATSGHDEQKSQTGNRSQTRDILAQESGISSSTFARYVKLASLELELLSYLDQGVLPFIAAYELSFITKESLQKQIAQYLRTGGKISPKTAKELRQDFEENGLANYVKILRGEDSAQIAKRKVLNGSMKQVKKMVEKRIPEDSYEKMEEILEKALDLYLKENPGALNC